MKIFFFLLIVVLGGAYFYVESQKVDFGSSEVTDPTVVINEDGGEGETDFVPTEVQNAMRVGENAIVSFPQRPSKKVTLASVYLAEPGYAVIYTDVDGVATEVIGASELLNVGENTDVTITLADTTVDGLFLWAFLHTEANDTVTFDAEVDTKVTDGMGETISSIFEIREDAVEKPVVAN